MNRLINKFNKNLRSNSIRNKKSKVPGEEKKKVSQKLPNNLWLTSSKDNNIRVVVGLDFGTTYSGFAYCHVNENQNICSNDSWHGEVGQLKTNTVLQYDNEYKNVKFWGAPALAKKQSRRTKTQNSSEGNKPVELFKLHLGDLLDKFKPKLPVDYKKAITDYLREIGKVIQETVATHWPKIDYFANVLLVITVPAELSEKSKAIMRICAFDAGLIKEKYSTNLQFTTEPEAAAVYCMENLKGQTFTRPGNNFMIVDCGGGTVDLTIRKLINDKQLGEITERTGDFCGSTFIDKEFIKYLRKILGDEPIDLLRDNNYGQMQYLIQQFCKYDNIQETCSAMFLVGGFSESKYLQKKINEKFNRRVETISVPTQPMAAIARGATIYGLSIKSDDLNNLDIDDNMKCVISSRVLKYSYGVEVSREWENGDPIHRMTNDKRILKFDCLARRGTKMNINQEVTSSYVPLYPNQKNMAMKIYYTREYDGIYCDDPGMKHLGTLIADLPGSGLDRSILFGMTFGKMEIIATSKDEQTGKNYKATFTINLDD
ncbi:hypothetical protein C1645_834918 [Glomus cerebriforme]|uniref:Actin-like ATPase domain-containing protein n=1 Tax=Glomus cerebriforme TaxID=658196 RepID=A0A397SB63_9GLOM|nr:hypothetical protein C1645_834918 [Glomus cerebriforme]